MTIIACYSNKGGVGKTATAVNLAYLSASRGYTTLICDMDPQGASSYYFRVKPSKKLKKAAFFQDVNVLLKSIRASDFDHLDVIPANMTFRNFDIFLARMKNSRSRLKKALKVVENEYDVIFLDCPPNISRLSENVFKHVDFVLVPVIPTTLSERTLLQLEDFFKTHKYKTRKIIPFFSMVQRSKKLHRDTMRRLRKRDSKFLIATIPFSTHVERMGIYRTPVFQFAPSCPAVEAYDELWTEIEQRIKTV